MTYNIPAVIECCTNANGMHCKLKNSETPVSFYAGSSQPTQEVVLSFVYADISLGACPWGLAHQANAHT